MSDKFVWQRGDVVITPATEETWNLAYYSGESHLLVTTLDGLTQHLLQRNADVNLHEEIIALLETPKAKNMPPELRQELVQLGYLAVIMQGDPAVLTAAESVATRWKELVAAATRGAFPQGYVLAESCHVELIFHLPPKTYATTALHNLLKAPIDGLGQVLFAPSQGTKLTKWHTEDWRVTSLAASKKLTDREPRLEFKVVPGIQPCSTPASNHDLLIDATIAGNPPLYASNMEKELAWRKQLMEQVTLPIATTSITRLAASVIFTIKPSSMAIADLDNFCVPAMIGLKAIGLSARNVVELHAIKQIANESDGASTQMYVWTDVCLGAA